jgi:AcrR family transcriptional regulator
MGKRKISETPDDGLEAQSDEGPKAELRTVRQRTPRVRQAVLDVAAELFAQRGFKGTNLRDVADVLGMSRPGLYYHFASKEQLLEAIIEEVTISGERNMAEAARHAVQDPKDALRMVVLTNSRWILEHPTLFRMLDRVEVEMPPELLARHSKSKRTIVAHLTDIIERGITKGQFRPVTPKVAAFALLGMCNWAAWWFKPNQSSDAHEVSVLLADFAMRMLVRSDSHRMRTDQVEDILRILKEDVAHLEILLKM